MWQSYIWNELLGNVCSEVDLVFIWIEIVSLHLNFQTHSGEKDRMAQTSIEK